jgi:hypothetical protein
MVDNRDGRGYNYTGDDTNASNITGCDVKWFNAEE